MNYRIPIVWPAVFALTGAVLGQGTTRPPDFSRQTGRFDWGAGPIPECGLPPDRYASIDQAVSQIVRESGIPGGAFAIGYKGKLIFSRGYGFADVEKRTPFTPDTLCHLASVSKPLTHEIAMTLVRMGLISEGDAVVPYLESKGLTPLPEKDAKADPRLDQITVRELLDHTSGIEAGTSQSEFDYVGPRAGESRGPSAAVAENRAIRRILGRTLTHAPGEHNEYSNWGYDILAKFLALKIQERFGISYEQFAREKVIALHGDPTNWHIVSGRQEDLLPHEATYYESTRDGTGKYTLGFADLIRFDLHKGAAGWASSADALAEYFNGLMDHGWTYLFFGSLPGNLAMFRTYPEGLTFAFVTNMRPPGGLDPTKMIQDRVSPLVEKLIKN